MYYPTLWELFVLAITVTLLCGAGMLVFRPWTRDGRVPPISLALAAGVTALGLYLAVTHYLFTHAHSDRALVVAATCFAFWLVPAGYYSTQFLGALAGRSVGKLSWLSGPLPELDTFSEARELAIRGDVDAAVARYLKYSQNRVAARMAAARLLEADGRVADSAAMFEAVRGLADRDVLAWAEATFRLAKLNENSLKDARKALDLYSELVTKAPHGEYGHLAASNLARLRVGGDALLKELDQAYEGTDRPSS